MNELIEAGDSRAKVVGKCRLPAALNHLACKARKRPFKITRGVYRLNSKAVILTAVQRLVPGQLWSAL